jgi:cytochrome c nitrite reductase small subunit
MATAKKPAPRLRRVLTIAAAALCGCAIGAAIFGVGYSELPSYFSNDPVSCANCHVMQDHYDAWLKGAHARSATCDECHLPHDNVIKALMVQAEDGVLHAYSFTRGNFPENIVIRDSSRAVVNSACVSCHDTATNQMRYTIGFTQENIDCTHCHFNTGHI